MSKWKEYRRQRLYDRIEDLDYYIKKWSWSFSPSKRRRYLKLLKKLNNKFEKKFNSKFENEN